VSGLVSGCAFLWRPFRINGGSHGDRRSSSPHRSPILWVSGLMLVTLLAGCVVTIWIAISQPDESLSIDAERLLKVPVHSAGNSH